MLNTDKTTGGGTITLLPGGLNSALQETSYFLGSDIAGAYILAALGVGFFLLSSMLEQGRRRKAGIPFRPTLEIALRSGGLAVLAFGTAFMLNQYYGVPNALLIFVIAVMACDLVLRRTSFGRKVFAVGGNIEAARRAGISVPKIRIAVFTISSTFGALSGLFFAAQTNSATLDAGQGAWLMLAIASAVVGGTSLFGGRGKAWSALLGALLIQSIAVGLDLLNMQAWDQYMVTAVVVLAAVIVDSLSRRTQKSSGRG
jgi:D-xylose transport system permease protein